MISRTLTELKIVVDYPIRWRGTFWLALFHRWANASKFGVFLTLG